MVLANNKKELRIVYMGTPEFAIRGLEKLLDEGYAVVGVITAPDKPAGRGRKLTGSAVKKYAEKMGLPVLQPANLKEESFLKQLKSLNANLQIVVAFRMLPRLVWEMPEYGTFNLHASLLPQYRGAAPINWAIVNGEAETGVTTFFIDEKIDTGEIILQEKTPIAPTATAGELHDRLMELGAKLILQTVQAIASGAVKTQKQPQATGLKMAPKIHRETCRIDWNQPMEKIYDHIRGLSPYPTAWTQLKNGNEEVILKIYKVKKEPHSHRHETGKLFSDKKRLKIAVKAGFLELLEIQLPGRRKMAVEEVINGLTLHKDAHVF